MLFHVFVVHIAYGTLCQANTGDNELKLMMKHSPEWGRDSNPVIRSPARYPWTTARACNIYYEYTINDNAYVMTYYHTQDDGTTSVNTSRGSMLTTTTVMCDIPDLLTLGDMAYPIIYNYTIALSNNRENFATVVTNETRLVWQSGLVLA